MAILYAQQRVELREVVLKQKPESLLNYSQKATVPILVLSDGSVIDQSLAIMQWAISKYDPDNWQDKLSEQTQLIEKNDTDFKANLDKYKYADRHPEPEIYYRTACYEFLDNLDTRLKAQRYLYAEHYCLADIAIFPFIRQFAHVDLSWFETSQWQYVKRWLNELKSSDLFLGIMHKYPAWTEHDKPTFFP
tara:strand:- start:8 stop:580 length:573 start_codon:yes stop_codon:yes gene_type:complete